MKKIVLSLAGVMAAAAFAPEASALPVFARQTGMACTACHFQHFPAINGFGRAFKAAGFTMMGAQEKVEGEHLSMPAVLNMGILVTAGMETANNNVAGLPNSRIFVPNGGGELQIFFGGRINDFSGWLSELGTANGGLAPVVTVPVPGALAGTQAGLAATPGSSASGKLHIMPEVAPGIHAGVTLFNIGQGAGGAMEMLNTGATSIHRLMGKTGGNGASTTGRGRAHIEATSARQYVAPENGGSGAAVNVVGDKFAVTYAREAQLTNTSAPGSLGVLNVGYFRAVGMFDLAGFDTAVGIQNFNGTGNALTGALGAKATIVDFQMQGQMGEMPLGLYASYGTAPASADNVWNAAGTVSRSSFNVAGELGVIPHVATVQLGLRSGKTGANLSDNAILVGATYELSMNMEVSLTHTAQSGSAWTGVNGGTQTTLLLETLF